ncbi:fimbria/pilus outer membrane usher protein [Cedecea neteri]|uniref:fimbria/pilus outer membrane usher protein n=1 Tax=Cedecea neteri TaxID=158822 RepID=UPI002AA78C8F|nr:fimbria/pilus outer membrane usher protein [Cedecea neteri]WPU21034.1 fimbria/pilus outer membrane usher protein [Cedecea neteri]
MPFAHHRRFRFAPSLLALSVISLPPAAFADDYFDPRALELNKDEADIDTARFSKSGGQLPGNYLVDIFVNGNKIDSREVTFVESDGKLLPEFTPAQLGDMGVKVAAFPGLQQLPSDKSISNIGRYIPGVDSEFDFGIQRLDLNIPQAALTSEARGYVDPMLWDQGLPALMMNYSFSGANTTQRQHGGNDDSRYLNLRSGANLGAWRVRNYSTWNDGNGQRKWQNVNSYLQRDIHALKGQFTVGDSATPGEVFDSLQYRGVQLASDDNMYPDSLRGFAPVVRGIARSNAQVTVRQSGYIIYQTYVPAGAFAISDLYPTSASGDLEVTITEADGSERRFVQPFSAVPVMLREGRLKYSATAGEYRTLTPGAKTPGFMQSTLIYGLPYDYTIYGGSLFAGNYGSVAAGVGHGFGDFGSMSADITQAKTRLRDGSGSSGQSFRFQYGKDVESTNTTFTLAGYRYSTSGFYDFREANDLDMQEYSSWRRSYNKRSRMQLNINQSLKAYGSVYLTAYQQDFWGYSGYERNFSAGYNFTHNDISYALSYTLIQLPGDNLNDQQFAFSMQVPLSKWLPNSWAGYGINSSRQGSTRQEVSLNGTALEDNNLSYNVQQGYENRGGGNSGNISADYRGTYGEVRGGYNYTPDTRQFTYGLEGGVVAHPFGVTLSQPLGDSMALVRAPGASHVSIMNQPGVKTDARGYAVVPYVSSYRQNRIALDTETLSDQVDIDDTVVNVVPTKGALALADFKTQQGSRVLMNLNYQGKAVPFGATATLVQPTGEKVNSSIVGPDGQLYISGMPDSGKLQIQWGSGGNQKCSVAFTLPVANGTSPVREFSALCQ